MTLCNRSAMILGYAVALFVAGAVIRYVSPISRCL